MTARSTRGVASRFTVLSAFAFLALTSAQTGAAANTTTVTYNTTGTEQTFTVPSGVTSIHIVAQGGSGGEPDAAFRPPAGGAGGQVTADLSVTPGQTLYIEVGGNGGTNGGAGGFNGGGGGGHTFAFGGGGGGGGGATDVRTVSRTAAGTLASRLLVAGGGGGGGDFTRLQHDGGAAGNPAGQNGATDPIDGGGETAGVGGGGGSATNPGGGGATNPGGFGCSGTAGNSGSQDAGGAGGNGTGGNTTGGGGGGGGLYGGGGGGVGCNLSGGGGGGGSDLVPDGGTWTTSYAAPSVTITYTNDADLALTNVPADITTAATSPAGAVVTYTPPTVVDEDSPLPAVTCNPASGSTFPIGTTTVTCTTSDSDDTNGPVSATFTVTVVGAAGQLQQLAAAVAGVGPGTSLADKVQQAENDLAAGDLAGAKGILNAFINEVKAQSGKKITPAQAAQLVAAAQQIIAVIG